MYRATITYYGTFNGRPFPFYIHLSAEDSQELEAEILETLEGLKSQGLKGRVCYN
jgi:hypothetical protein